MKNDYLLSVYLAGKITSNGWREQIAPIRDDVDNDIYGVKYVQTFIKGLITTGPFFISCDHGCYHGDTLHGVGAYGSEDVDKPGCVGDGIPKCMVPTICTHQIDKSNFVFAFIDSTTCYGTLCEIGYAIGKGIPVAVMFSNKSMRKDMWFIAEIADIVLDSYGSVLKSTTKEVDIVSAATAIAARLTFC